MGEEITTYNMNRIFSLKNLIIIFLFNVGIKSTSVVHALPSKNQTAISPSNLLESGVSKTLSPKSKTVTPKIDIPKYDIPITYNSKVRYWVNYFQGEGRNWFKLRMERSYRYLPLMQAHMADRGIPEDLAFVCMIESGFSPHATSEADAVGYWQFIRPTASRYGLRINWWIDERRDFTKSSRAAAAYLSDLYKMFNSWYLTAAAYNMGEGRLKRLIAQHKTDNFWLISRWMWFQT
jgi:membrane-bound lytic murein transglycosylase D